MTNEMPWVIGLTQKEVEELRKKKHELTEYGKQKVQEKMIAADYKLIAKELYETLKELRDVVDDANGTEYISKWNLTMTRTDAAIEYYEDYVNG